MIIERGDYFVITRGVELNMDGLAMFGVEIKPANDKPRYDRSWNDVLFIAHEVSGDVVCAEIVAGNDEWITKSRRPGIARIVNLSEVEVMTVTPEFAHRMIEQEA